MISRDRPGHFAEGATGGAPQAIQVADRWHLLRHLGEAVQRLLACHAEGWSCRRIAQELDLHGGTVNRYSIARELPKWFQRMFRNREVTALELWLQEAANRGVAELWQFAITIRRDEPAGRAALEWSWSNGQLEGQINRVKVIKRVGYGRAKLDLQRQRIWHRVVVPVPAIPAHALVQHQAPA